MSKVVVVTGGTSGIGKEVVAMGLQAGYKMVVISRNAQSLDGEFVYQCDVSFDSEVQAVFEKIKQQFGNVDVLVNNAGYGISGASELIPHNNVKNLFDVNVHGVINCTRHALPIMKSGAKIINISSAMAFFPIPYRTFYSATKSAVLNISYGMRMELEGAGISVSCVCPGDVKTNFMKNRVKFFETNEKYGSKVEKAVFGVDKKIEKRMSPYVVAKVVFKQINQAKPKAMTVVGFKYKVLYGLQKVLPKSLFLWATNKMFGG